MTSRRRVLNGVAAALSALLGSCGLLRKGMSPSKEPATGETPGEKPASEAERDPVRLVGEIVSVHREEGFVLIRRYAQGVFGAAELLSSLSADGTTCSLQLTGERLGRYYAADIQEGTPSKGDQVFVRRASEGPRTEFTPLPEGGDSGSEAAFEKKFPSP